MHTSHHDVPPLGLGLASIVLGAIGLLLFVLPILAIPICACGFIVGVVGIFAALYFKELDGRLAIAGAVVSVLAIGVELAIAYAPSGDWGQPADPSTSSPALRKRYIAPPARFRGQVTGCFDRFTV